MSVGLSVCPSLVLSWAFRSCVTWLPSPVQLKGILLNRGSRARQWSSSTTSLFYWLHLGHCHRYLFEAHRRLSLTSGFSFFLIHHLGKRFDLWTNFQFSNVSSIFTGLSTLIFETWRVSSVCFAFHAVVCLAKCSGAFFLSMGKERTELVFTFRDDIQFTLL